MNLQNDHNVYILGAGFSAAGGLPSIANFLTRMRDSHPWLIANGRTHEAEAVERVLEFRLKATAAGFWTPVDLERVRVRASVKPFIAIVMEFSCLIPVGIKTNSNSIIVDRPDFDMQPITDR